MTRPTLSELISDFIYATKQGIVIRGFLFNKNKKGPFLEYEHKGVIQAFTFIDGWKIGGCEEEAFIMKVSLVVNSPLNLTRPIFSKRFSYEVCRESMVRDFLQKRNSTLEKDLINILGEEGLFGDVDFNIVLEHNKEKIKPHNRMLLNHLYFLLASFVPSTKECWWKYRPFSIFAERLEGFINRNTRELERAHQITQGC